MTINKRPRYNGYNKNQNVGDFSNNADGVYGNADEKSDMVQGKEAMAFSKVNYIMVIIGIALVVAGFLLMTGGSSTTEAYNPDIFSVRRVKVAPMVCLAGFLFMVVAIIYHKKERNTHGAERNVHDNSQNAEA